MVDLSSQRDNPYFRKASEPGWRSEDQKIGRFVRRTDESGSSTL